jgi:hypothetical protein
MPPVSWLRGGADGGAVGIGSQGAEGFALPPKGDATERLWGRTE